MLAAAEGEGEEEKKKGKGGRGPVPPSVPLTYRGAQLPLRRRRHPWGLFYRDRPVAPPLRAARCKCLRESLPAVRSSPSPTSPGCRAVERGSAEGKATPLSVRCWGNWRGDLRTAGAAALRAAPGGGEGGRAGDWTDTEGRAPRAGGVGERLPLPGRRSGPGGGPRCSCRSRHRRRDAERR